MLPPTSLRIINIQRNGLAIAFARGTTYGRVHTQSRTLTTPRRLTERRYPQGKIRGIKTTRILVQSRSMASRAEACAPLTPSASVLLVSPTNEVLLLHRVRTASSFSSAHVFPGGALSPEHDGALPRTTHASGIVLGGKGVETDLPAYRHAAIRETFEESGILLAKKDAKLFTEISDERREAGRRDVHAGKILFPDLLAQWGCVPDTASLVPFTRWITPANVRRRFSTQMYLYLLPLEANLGLEGEVVIPTPTHDGGIEHTAARFASPAEWLSLARENKIILYPPQFFLLWMLDKFLGRAEASGMPSMQEREAQRERLMQFLRDGSVDGVRLDSGFGEKIISPVALGRGAYGSARQDAVAELDEGTAVLKLDSSGPELEKEGVRRGLEEWVVTTMFKKEGPRDVRVWARAELLGKESKL